MKIKSSPTISWGRIVIILLLAGIVLSAAISYAGDVTLIRVRGRVIKINNTADQVFKILQKNDIVDQKIQKDPNNPNSLLVVKNYNVNGRRFTIYFARVQDPGPYRVIRIVTD